MHILIVALHRPSKPTGVCRHAVNLASCLADTEKVTQITLIIGAWQLDYFKTAFRLDSAKIKLFCVDIYNNSFSRNLWFIIGLPQLSRQLNPDLIHLSFPLPFLRLLFPCPVVSTIHDLYPCEYPENFGYPNVLFNRWFLTMCIKNSDALSCVSQITRDKLAQYYAPVCLQKTATVVYNYVDFSQVTPGIDPEPNIKETDGFLLSVGQHRQNKNLDLLIKAYFMLRQSNLLEKNIKLIIVGANGPKTDELHRLIDSLDLQQSVLLRSSLDDSNLSWLYKNCELFIIPSSTEGFCLPLAEAIYFSAKVICSDLPIFREIGDSNCTYFELGADSVKNLMQAITTSLATKQQHHTSESDRFTKTKSASQYLQLYSQLAVNSK